MTTRPCLRWPLALLASAACSLLPALTVALPASSAQAATIVGPGIGLSRVVCLSPRQCVAVDSGGGEITFNPQSPRRLRRVVIDFDFGSPTGMDGLACTSVHQCVAVDSRGGEVTFDPYAPTKAHHVVMTGAGDALYSVACPSAHQCTAVSEEQQDVTFDPHSPRRWRADLLAFGDRLDADSIVCMSVSQCVAVGYPGEATFDPLVHRLANVVVIPPRDNRAGSPTLEDVSCPSAQQCTAVDQAGREVTFDPTSSQTPTRVRIDKRYLIAVSCPTVSQCTALGDSSVAITFNPVAPTHRQRRAVQVVRGSGTMDIACPLTTQCTAVAGRREVTFDPRR